MGDPSPQAVGAGHRDPRPAAPGPREGRIRLPLTTSRGVILYAEVTTLSVDLQDTAAPEREAIGALPAPFRWVLGFPRSPLWLAAGVALLYFVPAVRLVGSPAARAGPLLHAMYALYFAWVPLALVTLVRGTARDVAELAPALGSGPDALRRTAFSAGSRAIRWGLALGLLVAALDVFAFASTPLWRRAPSHSVAFVVAREAIICLAIFSVLAWAAGAARALSRATVAHAVPDILDIRPLTPLARCGTRMLLFWALVVAPNAVYFALPRDEVSSELGLLIAAISSALLGLAAAALTIPTWGAHRAIGAAKAAELDRVRGQLREAREARKDDRLPGLLAWEARIESASTWPIDAHSLRLSGLYVLIPLGGWIGGAVVERLMDALLG